MVGAFVSVIYEGPLETVESVMAWMKREQVDVEQDKEVYEWLGRKVQWGEMEAAMINKVFLRLVQSVG
jgi:hypothetical protein